ncbi:hypothetical protein DFH09DRAFT_1371307 [Mycena vulgaris]|nr:hypothetical protein DFH09DRAFT_1371307 [Mycena vulgaris]
MPCRAARPARPTQPQAARLIQRQAGEQHVELQRQGDITSGSAFSSSASSYTPTASHGLPKSGPMPLREVYPEYDGGRTDSRSLRIWWRCVRHFRFKRRSLLMYPCLAICALVLPYIHLVTPNPFAPFAPLTIPSLLAPTARAAATYATPPGRVAMRHPRVKDPTAREPGWDDSLHRGTKPLCTTRTSFRRRRSRGSWASGGNVETCGLLLGREVILPVPPSLFRSSLGIAHVALPLLPSHIKLCYAAKTLLIPRHVRDGRGGGRACGGYHVRMDTVRTHRSQSYFYVVCSSGCSQKSSRSCARSCSRSQGRFRFT